LKYVKELGKGEPSFTDRAVRALKKHLWPGNVRELENLIQKTLIINDGSHIDSCHFSDVIKFDIFCDRILHLSLEDMTKKYIRDVLQQAGGNKAKALKILKIDRKTLLKKLT
jgi:DNA-binding NtrC family response regulator